MDDMWACIELFHKKFGLEKASIPQLVDQECMDFRIKFMEEELQEFREAVENKDKVKAFDALLDLVYVAMGTAYLCNFPWKAGWQYVQHANMQKKRVNHASESKRGSQFDIVKPNGWVSPDIAIESVLLLHEYEERVLAFFDIRSKEEKETINGKVGELTIIGSVNK